MGSLFYTSYADMMEQLLLADTSVRQARVLRLNEGSEDAQWAVFIALGEKTGQTEQLGSRLLVKQIRRQLLIRVKASTTSGEARPIPKKWFVVADLPVDNDGFIDNEQLRRTASGKDTQDSYSSMTTEDIVSHRRQDFAVASGRRSRDGFLRPAGRRLHHGHRGRHVLPGS